MVTASARREMVGWMRTRGLSERRALRVVRMSASALRYQPRPDRNVELRQQIIALAQRHRRYGAGMIYLKLRQAGEIVNHKRVERLYARRNCRSSDASGRRCRSRIASPWNAPAKPMKSGQWISCLTAWLAGVS